MILVTGGRAQGKRAFVETQLCGKAPVCWVDGATAGLKEMEAAKYCFNFQAFLRRVLGGEFLADLGSWAEPKLQADLGSQAEPKLQAEPGCQAEPKLQAEPGSWAEQKLQSAPEFLAQRFLFADPSRVIVTDEIGGGIVPISGEERNWREETGRTCCCMAALSEQVWRVVCGIGTRIK